MFEFDFTDLSEKAQGDELQGTWVAFGRYGRKEYKIAPGGKSRLWFSGPDASGGELSGPLIREGRWHLARVATGEGARVGSIRACYLEEDDTLLLNFCREGEDAWGQDIVARREVERSAWDPHLRPTAELVMESADLEGLDAKERARLAELAERYNPTVNVQQHIDRYSSWDKFHCDDAYEESGEVLTVCPCGRDAFPAPVILLLLGNGHVDGREHMSGGGLDVMIQNEELRSKFYVVVPRPSTKSGLVRYTGRGWEREWNEDAVWLLFTQSLVRLGPKRADASRLYATGISMGARGVWHMALKYGDMLAAVAPISGQCYWPNDTWVRGPLPKQEVLERLRRLPMRAYQIDVDNYAGNPLRDVEWLTWGLEEKKRQVNMQYLKQKIEVQIREWSYREPGCGVMELWWVKGPLEGERGQDDHRLWLWVYEKRQWGLAAFYLRHRTPDARCWTFATKPISVDSSAEKARLEALWASDRAAADEVEARSAKEALVAELYGAPQQAEEGSPE